MLPEDVPHTAVSSIPWEWLSMLQGLNNSPANFNCMMSHVLRPFCDYASSQFDDIIVHSHAIEGATDLNTHLGHLRKLFEAIRENKLYANLKKCIFCTP